MSGATSKTYQVRSDGIFCGLPVLDTSLKGLRAVVVGASGQSGQPVVDVLSANSNRCEKVYALSRRPPATDAKSVEHVPVDSLWEPEKVASILRKHKIQVDHVFYFGYVQVARPDIELEVFGNPDHLVEINGRLFENFLLAMDQANVQPKRIVLQTGGKSYGVHQGPVNVPLTEGAARVELEPNFYYTQEDLLAKYITTHPGASYNVTMPQWILAAGAGTDMTSSIRWHHPISTGFILGTFYEWLVVTEGTAGESFNITDGSQFTFGKLWPILASWFGLEGMPPRENGSYHEVELPFVPRRYGPKGKLRSTFTFIEWAKEPATRQAWVELKEEHQLNTDPLQNPEKTFAFLQFALELTWSWQTSMSKARKFGWHGYVDSIESIHSVFQKFTDMKMIPPF
ncbi:NAD dependent epimerase/dehydratase family protein [Cladophialophora carrionii]|uniref:NAD dependent epimerase/dehydratase family protein n=1 Tax=Cladophialophora carrionii TaxID=86049 RepID=A0A1C1CNF0_9EURO|nr:NAD dependent epimerase/dehydratase family protein [Cladophialophora carrionii]